MIEATPAVKSQSVCDDSGISTPPRSVVQVPMADGEPTGLGEVSVSASMRPIKCLQKRRRRMRQQIRIGGQ